MVTVDNADLKPLVIVDNTLKTVGNKIFPFIKPLCFVHDLVLHEYTPFKDKTQSLCFVLPTS